MEARLPSYLVERAGRVLDAWGSPGADVRAPVDERVTAAAIAATRRAVHELHDLLATDPAVQRATPLELVRGATLEPTAVLAEAGVPPVVRDEFEERSFPDDRYGLAPRTFADLDEDLGPAQLVWGMAKAGALRASRPGGL